MLFKSGLIRLEQEFLSSYPVLINQKLNFEMKIRFLINQNKNLALNRNSGSQSGSGRTRHPVVQNYAEWTTVFTLTRIPSYFLNK